MEIWKSLSNIKSIQIFSGNSNIPNHAPFVFQHNFIIPNVSENGWIDYLNDIVEKYKVNYIFPAHDDVIVALASNFEKICAKVITSPLETCIICRSKNKTYKKLEGIIPTPILYRNVDEIIKYPVFIKPDKGQGSQNTHIIFSKDQLTSIIKDQLLDYVIMEYLPGDEFTIDCFSDRDKGLLFCGGRIRHRIRNGISMNCKGVNDGIFIEYANKISKN